MKTKRRISLLAVLICVFALVFSLGIMTACGNSSANTTEPAANAQWHYGTTAPADNLGKTGDHYLDTESLTAYVRTENGEWLPTTLYSGAVAPDDTKGETGDLYLDTENGVLYQKGDSLWQVVLKVKGENGRDGVLWFSGEKDPDKYEEGDTTLKDAQKGDFYLNTADFTVWQLQTEGWTKLGAIKGETGAQGSVGPAGPQGSTGSQGPTGAPGKDGENGKSAYELYLDQYKQEHGNTDEAMDEEQWLASLKGEQGEPGKDSVHFFNGEGKPEGNDAVKGAVEGDLYVGKFYGLDGSDAGSVLYRFIEGEWVPIMESLTKGQVNLDSLEKIIEFGELVAAGNTFEGVEVHLKSDIDFNDAEGASYGRRAAARMVAWEPIGTSDHPFEGTFDGENHTIRNFSVTTSDTKKPAGFFGNVSGATIRDLHFENATVTAAGSNVVGAVVVGESKGEVTLNNVTVSGGKVEAQESAKVGGLVGKVSDGSVKAEEVEVTVPELDGGEDGKQAFVGDGEITMEGDYATGKEVGTGFVQKTEYSSTGEVTATSYQVLNKEGLIAFAKSVNGTEEAAKNYKDETIVLTTDIDLKGENWTPIGSTYKIPFLGSFDGQGHTISNLKIVRDDHAEKAEYYGLFGYVGGNKDTLTTNNVIENLTIENVDIPAATSPTEENPHGDATNLSYVGAFAGEAYGTDLKNLTLKGDVYVYGKSYVGGIVGVYFMPGADFSTRRLDSVIENITIDAKGELGRGAVLGYLGSINADKSNNDQTVTLTNIKVKGVTLKGDSGVGGIVGHIQTIRTKVTIDGVVLTDVKILTTGCNNNRVYDEVGAIVGSERNTETYAGKNNTVVLKNLSGNISVEKDPADKQQATAVNGGVIGEIDDNEKVSLVLTIESNNLEITWNGEPLVAE